MTTTLLTLLVLSGASGTDEAPHLRYIGNAAFEITDGRHVILIDFPYRSGAYGYMEFDRSELHERAASLCLFTHAHADHFDPRALAAVGCTVAGPEEVREKAGEAPVLDGNRFAGATIRCIDSEHGDVDHCSWQLSWHGREMLLAGDVETLAPVVEGLDRLDLIVAPYWLSGEIPGIRERFPGARVILAHRQPDAEAPACGDCSVPDQGETFGWPDVAGGGA